MKLYWRISSFPELRNMSEVRRNQLVRNCFDRRRKRRFIVRILLKSVLVTLPSQYVLDGVFSSMMPPPFALVARMMATLCWFIAAGALVYVFEIIYFRAKLCDYLQRNHCDLIIGFCLDCGYNLRGNTSECCPECGRQLLKPEKVKVDI